MMTGILLGRSSFRKERHFRGEAFQWIRIPRIIAHPLNRGTTINTTGRGTEIASREDFRFTLSQGPGIEALTLKMAISGRMLPENGDKRLRISIKVLIL